VEVSIPRFCGYLRAQAARRDRDVSRFSLAHENITELEDQLDRLAIDKAQAITNGCPKLDESEVTVFEVICAKHDQENKGVRYWLQLAILVLRRIPDRKQRHGSQRHKKAWTLKHIFSARRTKRIMQEAARVGLLSNLADA
jgi:hypothetical protein